MLGLCVDLQTIDMEPKVQLSIVLNAETYLSVRGNLTPVKIRIEATQFGLGPQSQEFPNWYLSTGIRQRLGLY